MASDWKRRGLQKILRYNLDDIMAMEIIDRKLKEMMEGEAAMLASGHGDKDVRVSLALALSERHNHQGTHRMK